MQTHGTGDQTAVEARTCQIDATVCDVLVLDSDTRVIGRPSIEMTVDPVTRLIVDWRVVDDEPPSDADLNTPANPKPVPERLLLDNGRIFGSHQLLDALQCDAAPAPAPAARATIERFLRAFE